MSLEIDGYTIQKKLGSGGMSTVYLAIQESLGRPCALKVMSSSLTRDESFTHRFKLEGKTIAKLQHSNIVNIYDIATQDDLCYLAMEYLPGATLNERLREDLSLRDVLSIVKQVAGALGFAHEHNIIHRDIKPANIMFRRDGAVVLTDFGIAKNLSEETAALTGTGSLIGTPAYMSPEQIQVGTLTGRSDLYSLGIVFYETLIGLQPYVASNPIAVAFMHVNEPIPTLPEPIGFLQDLLNKVLAKEPGNRFDSAAQLIDSIEKIEREHDAERIMLLHSQNTDAASMPQTAEPRSVLSQIPDTKLITVVDGGQPASHVPTASAQPARSQQKIMKWGALAVLIGLLAFGGISYQGYRAEQQQQAYAQLLDVARRQIEQQRFVAPDSDNLYHTLTTLHDLSPGDARAKTVTITFADQIRIAARREQAHGTFDTSLALIDKGLQFAPDDNDLLDLRKQVEAQNLQRQRELQQQQQQQAIERLLALADAQIEADQLTAPVGDNAVNSLRQVLALAPDQQQALASLDGIAERYAQRAADALQANDESLASDVVEQGLAIAAGNNNLLAQQKALQARIAQRENAKQARLESEQKTAKLLSEATNLLEQGKLVSPKGSNAAASFQQILKFDKGNETAKAGLKSVAAALAQDASSLLATGELEAGLQTIDAALAIAPDDKALQQQRQQFLDRQQQVANSERERQEEIKMLLDLAQTQISQRKLKKPANDNAVDSLEQVLALKPDYPQALAGMRQVADAYENLAREQLAAGADDLGRDYADAGLTVMADHNGLLAVKRELVERRREKALRDSTALAQRGQQINKLLESATVQFDAQQFTTPDNDNAYASWRAVLTLDPENSAARQALAQLPENILRQAGAALDKGELTSSEQILQQGLQVWPENADLRDLQSRLAQQKTAQQRERDIAVLLKKARQQQRDGQLFTPQQNNAVTNLRAALKLDAENTEANDSLNDIVATRLGNARDAIRRGQFEQAEALLDEFEKILPGQEDLLKLRQQLAASRHIASLLQEAQQLGAQNLFTLPAHNNALLNYRKVLALNPVHEQASAAVAQLGQTILADARQALQDRDWQLCTSLIQQGLVLLPGDKSLLALNTRMVKLQAEIAQQQEQQQLAQRVERLVTVARNQVSRRQLSAPAGDNAVATLEQILLLDPDNSDALTIRESIVDRYENLVAEALRANDDESANLYAQRGLQVDPDSPGLKAQREDLLARQQQREAEQLAKAKQLEEERQAQAEEDEPQTEADSKPSAPTAASSKRINELISKAEQQRQDGRLLAPAKDNALASYRQALQLDPQSDAAKQGLETIHSYYQDQVQSYMQAGDIPMAAAWLEAAIEDFPDDTTLQELRQQELLKRTYYDELPNGERGPALVYIPAGSFTMGDSVGNGFANELPAHRETISRGFMLGAFEVTFAEYDRFVSATKAPSPNDQGWGRDSQPVINVDWQQAQAYLAWLSEQTPGEYRLPSEMEWEYAARAGTDSDYWWGESVGSNNANCQDCGSQFGGKKSMPVGSFAANPFGLFDTAGNVHEWTSSPYSKTFPSDGSTLAGPGSNAVARGGSWYDMANFSRVPTRVRLNSRFKNFFVGFRVLRSLPTPTEKQ